MSKNKTAMIRVRVQQSVKDAAEAVLKELGISPSDAVRIFYKQIVLQHGLPFGVLIPNERTQKSIDDARAGRNLKTYDSIEEMFKDMGVELDLEKVECELELIRNSSSETSRK